MLRKSSLSFSTISSFFLRNLDSVALTNSKFSEVSLFLSQLVVQLQGELMQIITFFRMQGLQKLLHLWQSGDSHFSQYVDLLVALCNDVLYFSRGKKRVISEEVIKLFGYGHVDFTYVTLLGGFAVEHYVF